MDSFGEEQLDWPAKSDVLINLIEHIWDKLESTMRVRPSRPTSLPDITKTVLEERKSYRVYLT